MDTSIRPMTDADRFNTHELWINDDPPADVPTNIKNPVTGKISISMCKHCRRWGERLFEKTCAEWRELP